MVKSSVLCRRTSLLLSISSIVFLVSLAPAPVCCDFKETAGKFMSSFTNSVKDNLGPAVKKVTKTASDALDAAKKTVLGPDLSNERDRESCPTEGCPDSSEDSRGDHEAPPPKEDNEEREKRPKSEVATMPGDPGVLDFLFSSATNGLATVGRTLYDTMSDMSSRFADTVRKIMNEELYDILAASASKVGQAIFTPGATLFYLGETAASISLALLCLLISYILMRFLSLLFILTFVSATFLLHQAVGPVAIFEWTFWAGSYFLEIFYFLLYHYYVTTICTVVLFGFAVTRRITRETDRHIIQDIRILMLSQTQSIGQLQNSLNTLNRRLVTMEGKQNEMKRTLDQMKTKLDRIQNVGEAGRPADEVMRPVDEADGPVGTSRAANSV